VKEKPPGLYEKEGILVERLVVDDDDAIPRSRIDCDSLRSPSDEISKFVDDTLTSTRLATKMRVHDSRWRIRSLHPFPDRRSEDLALFRDPWRAGKIPETRFWGMLVVRT